MCNVCGLDHRHGPSTDPWQGLEPRFAAVSGVLRLFSCIIVPGWGKAADKGMAKGKGKVDCRDGMACTRWDCAFEHPPGWERGAAAGELSAAAPKGKGKGKVDCRDGMACTRWDCAFEHPPGWERGAAARGLSAAAPKGKGKGKVDCRDGMACTRWDCAFEHPPGWERGAAAGELSAAAPKGKGKGKVDCRDGMACTRWDCAFEHPPGWERGAAAGELSAAAPKGKGKGKGKVDCRDGMACTRWDCAFEHPPGWERGAAAGGSSSSAPSAPSAAAAKGKGKGKSQSPELLEAMLLAQKECDTARLPSVAVSSILEHALAIKNQFDVDLQALSHVGIILKGTGDALCKARSVLSQMANLQDHFTMHRLIVSKCRLLEVSADERELADQLWQGRRVLVQKTGQLCVVQKLRVEAAGGLRLIATLKLATAEDAEEDDDFVFEEGAEGLLCWDAHGRPDAVTVEHKTLGSHPLCEAFMRNCCSQVAPVESVEVTAGKGDFVRSRVTFDISAEPFAAARAVALLDGRFVGSLRLKVLVACPRALIQMTTGRTQVLRVTGHRPVEELKGMFPKNTVRKVTHSTKTKTSMCKFFEAGNCRLKCRASACACGAVPTLE